MPAPFYVDDWSVIYGLPPLIPDPLMMVVNRLGGQRSDPSLLQRDVT